MWSANQLTYYSAATTTMSLDAVTRTAVAADLSFPLKSVDNYLDSIHFSRNVPTLAHKTYSLTSGSLDFVNWAITIFCAHNNKSVSWRDLVEKERVMRSWHLTRLTAQYKLVQSVSLLWYKWKWEYYRGEFECLQTLLCLQISHSSQIG